MKIYAVIRVSEDCENKHICDSYCATLDGIKDILFYKSKEEALNVATDFSIENVAYEYVVREIKVK